MGLSFLGDFNKAVGKMEGINTSSAPPAYWFTTGNYVLNKIMSGSFKRGIAQGRVAAFCGLSGVGKSFLTGCVTKAAQQDGAFVLVIDSENALDDDYMGKIGVNLEPDSYSYTDPILIDQATKIISTFTKGYRSAYKDDPNAPKVLIVIDSLDMLMTESEQKTYEKGETSGDQGQQAKQLKKFLKTITQDIKNLNISLIVTKQVYKAQGMFQPEPFIITESVKYCASQILLLNKLKLREEDGGGEKEVTGIRMQVEVYKTRFTKPFQKVTINVPYETGLDPWSGLFEVAEALGIITKPTKGYYQLPNDPKKYRQSEIEESMMPYVLELCEQSDSFIAVDTSEYVIVEETKTTKDKKAERFAQLISEE